MSWSHPNCAGQASLIAWATSKPQGGGCDRDALLWFRFEVHVDGVAGASQGFRVHTGSKEDQGTALAAREAVEKLPIRYDNWLEVLFAEVRPFVVVHRLVHSPLLDLRRRARRGQNCLLIGSRLLFSGFTPRVRGGLSLPVQFLHPL